MREGQGLLCMSATSHSVYSALFIPILGQLLKDRRQLCEENKKETVTAEGEMYTPQHFFSRAFSTTGEVQSVPPCKLVTEQAMQGMGLNPSSLIQSRLSTQVKGLPPHIECIAQVHCLA